MNNKVGYLSNVDALLADFEGVFEADLDGLINDAFDSVFLGWDGSEVGCFVSDFDGLNVGGMDGLYVCCMIIKPI